MLDLTLRLRGGSTYTLKPIAKNAEKLPTSRMKQTKLSFFTKRKRFSKFKIGDLVFLNIKNENDLI